MSVQHKRRPIRPTRPLMLGLMVIALTTPATAWDWDLDWLTDPVLRGAETVQPARPIFQPGTPVYNRWDGFYVGGDIGFSETGADFSGGVGPLVAYLLREDVVGNHVSSWTTLPKSNTATFNFGAFFGYNTQWDEAIVGFEVHYNRISADHAVSDSLTRLFNDDTGAPTGHHFYYTATVAGSATLKLVDYGTIRARAAVEFGRFLPYAFGGLAIGRGTLTRMATVGYTRTDVPDATTLPTPPIVPIADYTYGPASKAETLSNRIFFGYTAGVGIDIAVMPNVFVRGEWEWVQFTTLHDVPVHLNTVRIGAGYRF